MDREDMVDLIVNQLVDNYIKDRTYEEDAELLLTKMEEAGMLPPYNPKHGKSSYDVAMGSNTHTWEDGDGDK